MQIMLGHHNGTIGQEEVVHAGEAQEDTQTERGEPGQAKSSSSGGPEQTQAGAVGAWGGS